MRILRYGAGGDKAGIKTSGEIVLNEFIMLVHDYVAPVPADMLKLIVNELSLVLGSIEYHVKKLEERVEKKEIKRRHRHHNRYRKAADLNRSRDL